MQTNPFSWFGVSPSIPMMDRMSLILLLPMLCLLPSESSGQLGVKRFCEVVNRNGVRIDMYIETPKTLCANKSWVFKLDVLSKPPVLQGGSFLSWKFKTIDCDDYVVENCVTVDLRELNNGINGRIDWTFDAKSIEEGIHDAKLQTVPGSERTRRLAKAASWIPMQGVVRSMNDFQLDSAKAIDMTRRIETERRAIDLEMEKAGFGSAKDPFETTQAYQQRIAVLKSKRDALELARLRPLERELQDVTSRIYRYRPEPDAEILLAVERYDADASLWTMGLEYKGRSTDVRLSIRPEAAKRLWTGREGISVHRVRDLKALREDLFEVTYGDGGTFSFLLVKSDAKDTRGLSRLEFDMLYVNPLNKTESSVAGPMSRLDSSTQIQTDISLSRSLGAVSKKESTSKELNDTKPTPIKSISRYEGTVSYQNTKQIATIMEFRYPAKDLEAVLEKYLQNLGGTIVNTKGFICAKQIRLKSKDDRFYDIYCKVEDRDMGSNWNSILSVIIADSGEDILLRDPNYPSIARIVASGVVEFFNGIDVAISNYGKGKSQGTGLPDIADNKACQIIEFNSKNIQFLTGTSTMTTLSKIELNKLVSLLNFDCPDIRIIIEGYTDNVGSPDANKTLSEMRAAAVKSYLVEKKVNARRLTSAGFGQDRPIADNGTPEGRALNRRIEIKISQ